MRSIEIYAKGNHKWVYFGRDPEKPQKVIDTNQYLVTNGNRSLLMDPGGVEIFSGMLGAVLKHTTLANLTDLFASHQDPDIISSLGLWDKATPTATLHAPWVWEGFLRHFGCNSITYAGIPDEGKTFDLDGVPLQFVPAHYLHSSGNYHVYDPEARILMSGDVGAALEPIDADVYVDNFVEHIGKMQMFHQRWMPSNAAKMDWIRRVRDLKIDLMVPQHGRMFKGDDVQRFLDWFEALPVGVAIKEAA